MTNACHWITIGIRSIPICWMYTLEVYIGKYSRRKSKIYRPNKRHTYKYKMFHDSLSTDTDTHAIHKVYILAISHWIENGSLTVYYTFVSVMVFLWGPSIWAMFNAYTSISHNTKTTGLKFLSVKSLSFGQNSPDPWRYGLYWISECVLWYLTPKH